jgi:hypothetical protein
MLHCRLVILLKMIVDIKVANVMLEFVDILKLQIGLTQLKLLNFVDDEF